MIIDTHLHENKYSSDSHIDFKKAIDTAKLIGLDGICVTNHDNNHILNDIGESTVINGVLVIVGAEILTRQGDILVFGAKDLPEEKLDARDLLSLVKKQGGVAIAAHPYRNNNRGLEDNLYELADLLDGVESFNGSTYSYHNLRAFSVATELGLPSFGAGDSHVLEKIGSYATRFNSSIRDHKDFIEAIKSKDLHPVMRRDGKFLDIDYCYRELLVEDQGIRLKK